MKHLKFALIAFIMLGTVAITNAQSKVAHISTQQLIEEMPAYQDAMSQLNKLQNSYKSQIEDMYKELQQKSQRYENEAPNQTDAENQKRMKEMQDSQERIRKFHESAQKEIENKQKDLIEPVLEKAKKAINKVAKEKGFDYVLDSSEGGGVLVADGYNLMPDVKKELGL